MESLNDDLFPEERPDARHALLELFPEEEEKLKEKRAEEIWSRIKPKVEEVLRETSEGIEQDIERIHEMFEENLVENTEALEELEERLDPLVKNLEKVSKINASLKDLTGKVGEHRSELREEIQVLSKASKLREEHALSLFNDLNGKLPAIKEEIRRAHIRINNLPDEYDDTGVWKELKELRSMLLRPTGGGNMNRNIWIGGNSSVLSRYTDINLKAGAGTTLTYTNNDTQKTVDITITGSAGSGIVRSVNAISTSQTAGAVAATDYVYVCSAGVQLTLPDAVGNTNLYTVKNTSTSSVLVSTTASETIDAQSNLILATQYTSVDLISDGSNWDIT